MVKKIAQVRGIKGIYFHAKWCAPCQVMLEIVQKLKKRGYTIDVWDFDVNKVQVNRFKVTKLPTFVIVGPRGEIKRWEAFVGEKEILRYLDRKIPEYNI